MTARRGTVVVAMLRGINVGGHRKVAMAELRALAAPLAIGEVRTYIQSGNLVLATARPPAAVASELQERIESAHGFEVGVVVRTEGQLRDVLAANPYLDDGADQRELHVTFLAERPPEDRLALLEETAGAASSDRFEIHGSEVYLQCPGGYGNTKLTNTFFERRLGVAATTRNWRTVGTLAAMAADVSF